MPRVHEPRHARKPHLFDGVVPGDIAAAGLSESARILLSKRFLKQDAEGRPVERPEDMFWRVARTVADVDAEYGAPEADVDALAREFYDIMISGKFGASATTLRNSGRALGHQPNCIVLPIDDALSNGLSGIYDTLKYMTLVHQAGAGVAFSFSRLSPGGDPSSPFGPVSLISLFEASSGVVKRGGDINAAIGATLRVDHPEIRSLLDRCRQNAGPAFGNVNISVALTDAFLQGVQEGTTYDLVHPASGRAMGHEDPRAIFDMIIHSAWLTGEPSLFFVDRANEHNAVPRLGSYEACSLCGEQPLLPYDASHLGAINLSAFINHTVGGDADPVAAIDWDAMQRVIHLSVHFLDNVIDASGYPLLEIHTLAQDIRRIGLGLMGWADMLVRLGLPYDSQEGVDMGRKVMGFLNAEARRASEHLAETRGVFPAWEASIWGPDEACARRPDGSRVRPKQELRNCNLTTVGPTGTSSIFAGCSGGIEPLFAVAFMRSQAGSLMPDVNPDFARMAKEQGWYSDQLMERIATEGHIHFDEVPEGVQQVFRTAHDITPEWHVRMQAAFQEHCDSAISKTINFPREATEEQVRQACELAYELGCKGVTVYRNGSREWMWPEVRPSVAST